MHQKQRGVTLFEMLLVLMVSSAIAVSTYQYQQRQRETNVANLLSNEMYVYAQTVKEYIQDNQAAIAAGTFTPNPPIVEPSSFTSSGTQANTTYVITGVSWINNQALIRPTTGTPYVASHSPISFDKFSPLALMSIDGTLQGDKAVSVTFTASTLTIDFGALYEPGIGTKSAKPQTSISANAAKHATGMFDPLLGASSFTYSGGVDAYGAPESIKATLSGSVAPTNLVQAGQPIGGNIVFGNTSTMGTSSAQSNNSGSIQTSGNPEVTPASVGNIENVQGIQFDTASNNNQISGLNSMTFGMSNPNAPATTTGDTGTVQPSGPPQPGEIDNLGVLNFATVTAGGGLPQINNLGTLNFSAGGNITNIQTINFTTTGTITNLTSIAFAGANGAAGPVFNGVQVRAPFVQLQQQGQPTLVVPVRLANNEQAVLASHFCSLASVEIIDAASGIAQACSIGLDASNNYTLTMMQAVSCSVMCFRFTP